MPAGSPCFVAFFLFLTAALSAQTAMVRGRVTDQSEAVVPASKVTLIGSDGHARTAKADGTGTYSFNAVAPGKYTVQASPPRGTLPHPVEIVLTPERHTLHLH